MDGVRLGFEVANLYPEQGGVYTYCIGLLGALADLPNPPRLTFVDGLRYRSLTNLRRDVTDLPWDDREALRTARFVSARRGIPPYGLRTLAAGRDVRVRRVAAFLDDQLLRVRPLIQANPLIARAAFTRSIVADLDVCHWSDGVLFPLPRIAHVVTIHDTIPLNHPEWCSPEQAAYHVRKLRVAARHATRIIAVSEHTRRDVVELLGIAPDRIDVVPEAPAPGMSVPHDIVAADAVLSRYGLTRDSFIVYLGNCKPHKNVERLVTAFDMARRATGNRKLKLVLGGDLVALRDEVRETVNVLCLDQQLVRTGRIPSEDLPAILHGALAVAHVSLYEGFGLPPLEAMACGAAVVASEAAAVPEVVGDAALLVNPFDTSDIAAALVAVMTRPDLVADLRTRSIQRARTFSWRRTAEMTMDTYKRAADAGRLSAGRARKGMR